MPARTQRFTIEIPVSLVARVERAAALRDLDVPTFVVAMLAWYAPGADNEVQYLKEKIRAALEAAQSDDARLSDYITTVGNIEELVR